MLNQVVLVGRITNDIKIEELENTSETMLTLAIPRSLKNANGEYETDFIDCVLTGIIAKNTAEYCKKGDIVGVKGRLECNRAINQNKLIVVAEKVTFLSSKGDK